MTNAEKREAARQLIQKWHNKGREDEDDRSYWLDILQRLLGCADATDRIEFQKKVIVNGNTKRIDAYIPETKIIIEQKSEGIPLDKKISQSGGTELTPYEQAKRYNDNLPTSEKAKWIITSNFQELWIYDMDTRVPENNVVKIHIDDLHHNSSLLDFLLEKKVVQVSKEVDLSQEAGKLVGKIYDAFLKQYHDPESKKALESLNVLCVRLVFCLYSEDAGLFEQKDSFSGYIAQYEPKDLRPALLSLFKVLDTPYPDRPDLYLSEELEAFPYVNGGLFANEDIIIPKITQEIKDALAEAGHFNWRDISPTIFGAVFESTLNPVTRRKGGMHYTSIENIHKVIDPLFLDDLKNEFAEILTIGVQKQKKKKLEEFQNKLAGLTFLDPACGSGNFLTETYISLRRLENDILRELQNGQVIFGDTNWNPIKVSISQFYGIEINDFAGDVAKTALWIAESQMMKETEDVVLMHLDFLPLKSNVNIHIGNALQMDWASIISPSKLSYIMGNPPFIGASMMTKEQKEQAVSVYGKIKLSNSIDYVGTWYHKAAAYIDGTTIRVSFVSTNSITQGEQVAPLWDKLVNRYGVHIDFAYRTFKWNSEASEKAAVHCVIIGFSQYANNNKRKLYLDNSRMILVENINPYLLNAPDVLVSSRSNPICDVPKMLLGNKPADGGNLILSSEERDEIIKREPNLESYIHPYIGAVEYINNKIRYCFWLVGVSPSTIKNSSELKKRLEAVREMRLNSSAAPTREKADMPGLFFFISQPSTSYLLVPSTSSENRRYIPIGFLSPEIIASNSTTIVPNATLYNFGIMTSNVHMSWMRTVGGRLKSDYRYSGGIVYNTFPWPTPTEAQKAKIEQTAQAILDARALYPDSSLADLYDEVTMPPELRKAHQNNDRAVMQAYGLSVKDTSEADCAAFLMKRYQELTQTK